MGPSWLQILVVAVLVLLLFGRGQNRFSHERSRAGN